MSRFGFKLQVAKSFSNLLKRFSIKLLLLLLFFNVFEFVLFKLFLNEDKLLLLLKISDELLKS
jgi:hypothetical protein